MQAGAQGVSQSRVAQMEPRDADVVAEYCANVAAFTRGALCGALAAEAEGYAMILPMLLALQTSVPPDPPAAPVARVDLPPSWHPGGCLSAEPSRDIIVCGKRDAGEQYRVRPLPEKYAEVGGPGIGIDLGKGARGNLHTEPGGTADGKIAKRIMFTVTMPF